VYDRLPDYAAEAAENLASASGELADCYSILEKLAGTEVIAPDAGQCKLLASHFPDGRDGVIIGNIARDVALRLCHDAAESNRSAGVQLLKQFSKHGDLFAKLLHAKVLWLDGPLQNHQHSLDLVNELLEAPWYDLPWKKEAWHAIGELFCIKGLLLLKGEKVRHDRTEALRHLKWAADKYQHSGAAYAYAQFHKREAKPVFAHCAKPSSRTYHEYSALAQQHGMQDDGKKES